MQRYFLEVAYKGTQYSGFQIQQNARTIQSEIEQAFLTLFREPVALTGSSRTDAGVHALQNFFHFDAAAVHPQAVYKLNAILPGDIAVKGIYPVSDGAHCRFDATGRAYEYRLYRCKSPFLKDTAYYYPYKLNTAAMQEVAAFVQEQTNFQTFSKAHTQVANYNCTILNSAWTFEKDTFAYSVAANRFLRGMVRMLVASMLRVGRGQLSVEEYKAFFKNTDRCAYAAPAHGLFLKRVTYPYKLEQSVESKVGRGLQ